MGVRTGVNILLEEQGSEASVERGNTLSLEDLGETADQTIGISWLRNETNTGSLERAKGDISEELGATSGREVDSGAVVGGGLEAEGVDGLGLEELVTSELEGALEEVAGGGWAEAGQEGASALLGDDLAETTDQAAVVGRWVELDASLNTVGTDMLALTFNEVPLPTGVRGGRGAGQESYDGIGSNSVQRHGSCHRYMLLRKLTHRLG
jgi:hypothetical protein